MAILHVKCTLSTCETPVIDDRIMYKASMAAGEDASVHGDDKEALNVR